ALRPDTPWLERRKKELGITDKEKTSDDSPFEKEYYAGGGSRLEGQDYFWFFTQLMLVTAVLFIPYAISYREQTHLQE
ncbi:MAG: hypothetical protein ACPG32_08005, partial [Akkermansiaceae bacterium]